MGLTAFKALANSTSGLIHAHDCQENSGTTLDDFSSSAIDSTLGTRGAFGGAALIDDSARAVTCSGASGSGSVATRAVGGGNPIQALSEFTVMQVVQVNSVGGSRGFLERANIWSIRQLSNGQVAAYIWLHASDPTAAGTLQPQAQTVASLPLGSPVVLTVRFKLPFYDVFINGTHDARSGPLTGVLRTNSTTAMNFVTGSNSIDGLLQAHLMYDRGLDDGEIRAFSNAADEDFDRLGGEALFDFVADSVPIIGSQSGTDGYCGVTGGRMRINEPKTTASSYVSRRQPSMRKIERLGRPVIDASASQDDYAARCLSLIVETFKRLASRPNTSKSTYHDGTRFRSNALDAGTQIGNRSGPCALAAVVAKFLHGTRGRRGLPSPDPFIQIARNGLDYLYSISTLPDYGHIDSGEFAGGPYGEIVANLEGLIPYSEWTGLRDNALELADFFHEGGTYYDPDTGTFKVDGAEKVYYVNGNREYGEHMMYCNARAMDPAVSSVWDTRVPAQYNFLINPPNPVAGLPGGDPGGRTFGRVISVAGTDPEWSDGVGWLRESHGSAKGFYCFGAAADRDAGFETVDVNGYDPGYASLASEFMCRTWLVTGEVHHLQNLNLNFNRLLTTGDLNTTTWIVDGDYGSRHCANFNWNHPLHLILNWRSDRTDLSLTDAANQWAAIEAAFRSAVRTGNESFYRDMAYWMGNVLMAHDDFPRSW